MEEDDSHKYSINKEEKKITLYEFVKYHDLTKQKLQILGNFWFDCDSYEWFSTPTTLFVCSRPNDAVTIHSLLSVFQNVYQDPLYFELIDI